VTLKQRILLMDHVEDVFDERDHGEGLWVYYRPGFQSSLGGPLHLDHEETWPALYRATKAAVLCACDRCDDLGKT